MATDFVKVFVDYGPPYTDEPENLQGSLVDECAELNLSLFSVHMLLNERADPNIPDLEDLAYTPLHWCARNFHLLAAKLLRRAKADVNRPNEFGITPFGLCVITTPTANFVNKKNKMVRWFLRHGANVNHRDKGGYTPLDYACINNDLPIVKMLLEHGADTMRDNKVFCAPREPILNHCQDPDVYRIIRDTLELEIERSEEAERERIRAGADRVHAEYVEKLHRDLAKMKQSKLQKKQDATSSQDIIRRKKEYQRKLLDVLDYLKVSAEVKHEAGGWKRNEIGEWKWYDVVKKTRVLDKLYTRSVGLMNDLRKQNKIQTFDKRWKELTNGGRIELKWDKDKKFRIEGEVYSDDEENVGNIDTRSVHSFRDENDAELEGENLDELLDLL